MDVIDIRQCFALAWPRLCAASASCLLLDTPSAIRYTPRKSNLINQERRYEDEL